MARSIGDVQWRCHGVIAEPEIACGLHFEPGSALVLASDGVWDMWPLKDLVASVAQSRRPQEAAESIVTASASYWAAHSHRDDITALIVKPSTSQMAFVLQSVPVSLDHGFCTQQGMKPGAARQENQDCILKMHLPGDRFLWGVFDGHGPLGCQLSNRVRELFAIMASNLASAVDVTAAFRSAFAQCQA